MKLLLDFPELELLVRQMGAGPVTWQADVNQITELELQSLQNRGGLEITDINQVVSDDSGILSYKGQPVLLYIRDTQEAKYTVQHKPEDTRRFHVADCTTLDTMRAAKRFERYRLTQNTSGMFLVDVYESNRSKRIEEIEARLLVCKNCLHRVNYKNCRDSKLAPQIWKSFSIEEFLEEYKPTFRTKPKYTDRVGPKSDYPKDWSSTSQRMRAFVGWRCQKCNVYLGENHHRKLLQVHHRDGNKGNTSRLNLTVLCLECHAKEPMHYHLENPNKKNLEELQRIKAVQRNKIIDQEFGATREGGGIEKKLPRRSGLPASAPSDARIEPTGQEPNLGSKRWYRLSLWARRTGKLTTRNIQLAQKVAQSLSQSVPLSQEEAQKAGYIWQSAISQGFDPDLPSSN